MESADNIENVTGSRIKECRNELKLTQEQLGNLVHVTKQSVSKWEKGINIPEPPILTQLASLFNCSVDYILGKTDNKKRYGLGVSLSSLVASEKQEPKESATMTLLKKLVSDGLIKDPKDITLEQLNELIKMIQEDAEELLKDKHKK